MAKIKGKTKVMPNIDLDFSEDEVNLQVLKNVKSPKFGRPLTVQRFLKEHFGPEDELKGYDIRNAAKAALNMTEAELMQKLMPEPGGEEKAVILLQLIRVFVSKARMSTADFLAVMRFAYKDLDTSVPIVPEPPLDLSALDADEILQLAELIKKATGNP